MKAAKRTVLEQRRVRAARITVLALCALLVLLAIWQAAPGLVQRDGVGVPIAAQLVHQPRPSVPDPLNIEQSGITLMDCNEAASILWYQSTWNVEQSRALVERSLSRQGWQSLSTDDEPVMSFLYAPGGLAAGGTLILSLYPLEDGCSILIELL